MTWKLDYTAAQAGLKHLVRHLIHSAGSTVVVLWFISVSCSCAQDLGKPTVSPTMPFELVSGFLVVVDGQIGNLDGLKFILDTGATHSLIDRKVADRLHLKRRSGEVISFDRHIPVEWAIIPELRVGPIRTGTLRVMVVKLAEYSDLAEHADGIIGLDLLSQVRSSPSITTKELFLSSWQKLELLNVLPPNALSFLS